MAFNDIDRKLIDECVKDILDLDKIKALIANGADINAYDKEYEQSLYDEILDSYIDKDSKHIQLTNLLEITKLFIDNDLILSFKPDDPDYYVLRRFRFLPPDEICVNIFKMLLATEKSSHKELDNLIGDATLDLHLDMYYFYEQTKYSRADSVKYYLELIYWACAYDVKSFPEQCSKGLLQFEWFERGKNKVEVIREDRSTSVFVEDLGTHSRVEIGGWTMKY